MPLSDELKSFCDRWRIRADAHQGPGFEAEFDRFITLWIGFNALYTEAATRQGFQGIGDDRASQEILLHHLTARRFVRALDADPAVIAALAEVRALMRAHDFYFKLDRQDGARQPAEDEALLARLEDNGAGQRGQAILETLYSVRCNVLHGHKQFDPRQATLLRPMNVILAKVVDVTYGWLDR